MSRYWYLAGVWSPGKSLSVDAVLPLDGEPAPLDGEPGAVTLVVYGADGLPTHVPTTLDALPMPELNSQGWHCTLDAEAIAPGTVWVYAPDAGVLVGPVGQPAEPAALAALQLTVDPHMLHWNAANWPWLHVYGVGGVLVGTWRGGSVRWPRSVEPPFVVFGTRGLTQSEIVPVHARPEA